MSYYHALRNKEAAELAREAKRDAKQIEAARKTFYEDQLLKLNPHIGVVVRNGVRMFYTGAGDNMTANIEELV